MQVLTINAGSSSLKCSSFDLHGPPGVIADEPKWSQELSFGLPDAAASSVTEAVQKAIAQMEAQCGGQPDLVGHRVVHGAHLYTKSVLIDKSVQDTIGSLIPFAPLHNSLNLESIVAAVACLPSARQVAVFDTTFHRTMPAVASHYAVPLAWAEQDHIQRYGFHGISHQFATNRAAEMLHKKPEQINLIICHLGSGCSVTAVENGRSVFNSMGFTPLEGVMMGTRSGSIDPGVLLHLMRNGRSAEWIDDSLNKKSGLLGVSGVSNDMRKVIAAAGAGDERARLALDMFVFRLHREIGASLAQLQRLDALIFTGGIGEHSGYIRAQVSTVLNFLGAAVDDSANATVSGDGCINSGKSGPRILVVRSREDWQIARETWSVAVGA